MASEQISFMTELQKMILKYGGVASLLFAALWYQTSRLEKQETKTDLITEKLENRIKEVEQGLSDCNAERSALKVQVDYIQNTLFTKYQKRR
jgi:hypothetical protein